ncbi:MAG: 1-phosphofructokinase family hexose kinase [Pseudomonadota bacterium]
MPHAIATLTLNPALDKSLSVERVLPERKLRGENPRHDPGGGGVNVARAVGKLGGQATAILLAGGPTGARIGKALEIEGVAHRAIPIADDTRENLTVHETSTGLQYRFGEPGATTTPEELSAAFEAVRALATDLVVFSGSLGPGMPVETYADGLRALGQARVILDTSGPALADALGAGAFLIKPNLRELASLVGRDIETNQDLADAARSLVESGAAENVLVSLGAGGALLAMQDGTVTRLLAPTVRPVSKVGAGDSAVAGLVLSLARGEDLATAARWAVAAGTAATLTDGTELCRREDVHEGHAIPAAASLEAD